MKQTIRFAVTMLLMSAVSFAAEQTWTGRISSSLCSAETNPMGHDCIMNCIKAGAKYVFVAKGKSYDIPNQDFSDLEKHAGHRVRVTGELGADGRSMTVTQVEMTTASAK